VSKATLVAYAVSEFGKREVIGVEVADGKMEDAWRAFVVGLVARGPRGVQLVISDARTGLRKGIRIVGDHATRRAERRVRSEQALLKPRIDGNDEDVSWTSSSSVRRGRMRGHGNGRVVDSPQTACPQRFDNPWTGCPQPQLLIFGRGRRRRKTIKNSTDPHTPLDGT